MCPSLALRPLRLLSLACALWLSGCGGAADSYFPLEQGRWWEYAVAVTILDETARQKELVRNAGEGRWEGEPVRLREHPGGAVSLYQAMDEGVRRVATRAPEASEVLADAPGHFVLREPLAVGTAWQLTSRLSLIESRTFEPNDRIIRRRVPVTLNYAVEAVNDTVSVPAGRFEGCLRVRAAGSAVVLVDRGLESAVVEVEAYDWYAPGVGLVKSTRREFSDSKFLKSGEYQLELERSGG